MLDTHHPPITAAALADRLGLDRDDVAWMLVMWIRAGLIGGREFNGRIFYHGRDWQCTTTT